MGTSPRLRIAVYHRVSTLDQDPGQAERGDLRHVRVSNAVRFSPTELTFMTRARSWQPRASLLECRSPTCHPVAGGAMAKEKVSMTTFMDFVSVSGTTKVTVVRDFLGGDYSPAKDFYKAVREAIVDVHAAGKPKAALDLVLAGLKDPKKVTHYPAVIAGHKKFMGKRKLAWFKPPRDTWSGGGLTVSVNPELGLEIEGVPHIVKLYFKAEKLAKKNLPVMTRLMEKGLALGADAPVLAVLDVRRAALHVAPPPPIGIDAMLESEAAYFANLLASV